MIDFIFYAFVLYIAILFLRDLYFVLNPSAKKRFLESIQKEKERKDALAQQARPSFKEEERERLDREERRTQNELDRIMIRDADQQSDPYTYEIGQHANEALAIRYGIVNQEKKLKEGYVRLPASGRLSRQPLKDKIWYENSNTIRLKKTRKVKDDMYEVILVDYGNRTAKAIIEKGTEYVKTFYPLNEDWFERHAQLEMVLKGNGAFTLKELAKFHIDKTVGV